MKGSKGKKKFNQARQILRGNVKGPQKKLRFDHTRVESDFLFDRSFYPYKIFVSFSIPKGNDVRASFQRVMRRFVFWT